MTRTAIVTGATQGLGLALVEGLAARLSPADLVMLTGRDRARVDRATEALGDTSARVEGHVLDVTSTEAVQALAEGPGGFDIVISNASARTTPDRTPAEQVDLLVDTNNSGALRVLRSFGPALNPGG